MRFLFTQIGGKLAEKAFSAESSLNPEGVNQQVTAATNTLQLRTLRLWPRSDRVTPLRSEAGRRQAHLARPGQAGPGSLLLPAEL